MDQTMITIHTPIIEVPGHLIANLSAPMRRKLAVAVAGFVNKTSPDTATVEDLLSYFPARYEDRSNLVRIDELSDGLEAAVEVNVKVSGGFQVGRNRGPKQPPL